MSRKSTPTHNFALVVVRLGHRFLVVQERKHGELWYLPAGRVDPGETFVQAAHRETLEEASVPIVIESIVRIEHTPPQPGQDARCRVVFVARPIGDTPPKNVADEESLQAAWVTIEELEKMPVRGRELVDLFRYVAGGGPVYPLSILTSERASY